MMAMSTHKKRREKIPTLSKDKPHMRLKHIASLLSLLLSMLLGLISFWTLQTWGLLETYYFANQFFTGALVPLWFFPPWLRQLANLLPSQAQTFIPLAIYIGQVPAHEIPTALGIQVGWVIVLLALVWVVWQRTMRRVVVQGG